MSIELVVVLILLFLALQAFFRRFGNSAYLLRQDKDEIPCRGRLGRCRAGS